jgi:hypothetical protein
MANSGIDNTIYAGLEKKWATFFQEDASLGREEAPIVLACKPTTTLNVGVFKAFQQRPVQDPPPSLLQFCKKN